MNYLVETLSRAGPKRSEEQRTEDLVSMQHLYLQGWSRASLADRFGISESQVDYDLKKIRKESQKEWFSEIEEARDLARERELMMLRLAWEAFHKSKNKVMTCRACHGDGKKTCAVCKGTGIVEVEVPGNPDYLRVILKVLSDLRKLDGVDVSVNVPNRTTPVNLSLDALIRKQEEERARKG
jgi:hypothetical protein